MTDNRSITVKARMLLREMRRYARVNGTLPRIDTDDPTLQHAWIAVSRTIEHNSKLHRQAVRRSVAS